jgi:uncharacterized DUF497 family protein
MIRIDGLSWNERSEEHAALHSVTFEEIEQVTKNYGYARRSGEYMLVVGQTDAGRYLVAVLDYEGEGIWYPVTARPATKSERRRLRR